MINYQFCKACSNFLYTKVQNNQLQKECKHCDIVITEDSTSVKLSETNYVGSDIIYQKFHAEYDENGIPINKLLTKDPTLLVKSDPNLKAPSHYKHVAGDPVAYINDGVPFWLSLTTGEMWKNTDI